MGACVCGVCCFFVVESLWFGIKADYLQESYMKTSSIVERGRDARRVVMALRKED